MGSVIDVALAGCCEAIFLKVLGKSKSNVGTTRASYEGYRASRDSNTNTTGPLHVRDFQLEQDYCAKRDPLFGVIAPNALRSGMRVFIIAASNDLGRSGGREDAIGLS